MTTGGNRCGFYLNPDYLTSKVIRDDIKHIPLWLARWVNSTIAKYEDVPIETAPVSEYGMEIWQFGKGYVPGVKGAVDLNYILTKPPDEKPENNNEPSEWAKAATEWAKENGIFAGDGDGNFRWHDKITRQEAAQVIKNMYEFIMNGKGE
jgi:GH25 family lysozyme M1 (1,4-beta-N-acetylmuramidase)